MKIPSTTLALLMMFVCFPSVDLRAEESVSALPSLHAEPFHSTIVIAANRWKLDAELLAALIQVESRFKPDARSRTGAVGLAQFTNIGCAEVQRLAALSFARRSLPERLRAELLTFDKRSALNPRLAIEAAALFLGHLMSLYGGKVEAALTHYNAGRRAALAVHRLGFDQALRQGELRASQAEVYAPRVLAERARRQLRSAKTSTSSGCP